ncbi:rhodanese-like domain-containing protein [Paraglaciecola aquimarina]|uniref:Rhodanese-like domain-containing protein n=1 Tax=Paraglaciecola algarum TaxID=3050085 RepID=A0ABS9D9V7_9ALTE|nr:rhodanese-like domain-containing protein [Paraglaciecola sp. G1-23]MCF2949519.1 rhodanese-like domain-containing protein [Paraglaciecola sp. G1-23]
MFKKIIGGLIGLISLSAYAAHIEDITQQTLVEMDKKTHVIIDVRTEKEYQEGHVPAAINIPLQMLQDNFESVQPDKNKTLVLYCRSGYRAGKAAKVLQDKGYTNLVHLQGDMLGWQKSGLPIEK